MDAPYAQVAQVRMITSTCALGWSQSWNEGVLRWAQARAWAREGA